MKEINFSSVCRTCLGTKKLEPIFTNSKQDDNHSYNIFEATGITIRHNDGLPQNFCLNCLSFIKNTTEMRKIFKNTQLVLQEALNSQRYFKMKLKKSCQLTNPVLCNDLSSNLVNEMIIPNLVNEMKIPSLANGNKIPISNPANNTVIPTSNLLNGFDHNVLIANPVTENNDDNDIVNKVTDDDNNDFAIEINKEETLNTFDDSDEQPLSYLIAKTAREDFKCDNDNILTKIENGNNEDFILENEQKCVKKNNKTDEHSNDKSNNDNCNGISNSVNGNLNHYYTKDYQTNAENDRNQLLNAINNDNGFNNDTNNKLSNGTEKQSLSSYFIRQNDRNRVVCRLCQRNLATKSQYGHIKSCHPLINLGLKNCDVCDEVVSLRKLKSHLKYHEGGFNCQHCRSKLDSKETLLDHIKVCKRMRKDTVRKMAKKDITECDICHKRMLKSSLKLHKNVVHDGLGPVCDHCGRKFFNNYRLQDHLRAKHGYEKYKCSVCEFTSANMLAMENHERRHRGEKPYVCEACGAEFHAAYLLAQHKMMHRTQRLVKCDQCPASFKATNNLRMHKKSCHNKKSIPCLVCNRLFTCNSYLARHMKSVHKLFVCRK